jgi:hypothetical protein
MLINIQIIGQKNTLVNYTHKYVVHPLAFPGQRQSYVKLGCLISFRHSREACPRLRSGSGNPVKPNTSGFLGNLAMFASCERAAEAGSSPE